MERLRTWETQDVPSWMYALLVARSFQAVADGVDEDYVAAGGADSLVWWVVESARQRAAGRTLTFEQRERAFRWAEGVRNEVDRQTRRWMRTWFSDSVLIYYDCLRIALIHPADAATRLIDRIKPAAHWWERELARWLQTILRIAECLHPSQPAAMNPRWRNSDTLGLARAVLCDRAWDRLPILADALMDAGCDDDHLLDHLRAGGRHAEGCWALDLFSLSQEQPQGQSHQSSIRDPFALGWTRHWQTPRPTTRMVDPADGSRTWLAESMDAIVQFAEPEQKALALFGVTGVIRDQEHKAVLVTELGKLVRVFADAPGARPLSQLLEMLRRAPAEFRFHT